MNTSSSCCGSCATTGSDTALAIACTLGAGDFKERVAGIRALATRSLRSSRRKPLQLELTYDREALAEVEDLVAREADCCSFLAFELHPDATGVHLTITAPLEALTAADELFAHFAPELAREAA
jgi:hypothetical protein